MLLASPDCFSSSVISSIYVKKSTANFSRASRLKLLRRTRTIPICTASLITTPDSFEVGRLIGTYGFMNITSYSGFQAGSDIEYSSGDFERLRVQDVGEGSVKIRLYEGRISQGPLRGTSIIFKVYPGQRAGGIEADLMAANELNAHSSLQIPEAKRSLRTELWAQSLCCIASFSKVADPFCVHALQSSSRGPCQNLVMLVGGFETQTGEQWLAFRNYGRYSVADYTKVTSERISKSSSVGKTSWNPFEQEQTFKRRKYFVLRVFQGAMLGLAFMHENDRLHQSLGPASVVLNTIAERDAAYVVPRLRDLAFSVDIGLSNLEDSSATLSEGLWRRATAAGAFTLIEKRAFGIADDIYEAGLFLAYLAFGSFCEANIMDTLSLRRLLESTFQLDLQATREYCLADDRLVEAVKFLDLGDGAGWGLLQEMLNADFRKRPVAETVINHRFMTSAAY